MLKKLNARWITTALAALALAVPTATRPATAARPAINFVCSESQSTQIMIDIDGTFAHLNNTWTSPEVGRMLKFQCYPALGRDENNEWILVPYGSTRAWVNRSAVRFKEGTDIGQLPAANTCRLRPRSKAMRLPGVPAVSKKVQQIYQQALKAGRTPGMVTVIGDCNSEHPVFLGRLGAGAFNLAPYPALQKTAQAFSPAFKRVSVATSGSFNAGMAFDPRGPIRSSATPTKARSRASCASQMRPSR